MQTNPSSLILNTLILAGPFRCLEDNDPAGRSLLRKLYTCSLIGRSGSCMSWGEPRNLPGPTPAASPRWFPVKQNTWNQTLHTSLWLGHLLFCWASGSDTFLGVGRSGRSYKQLYWGSGAGGSDSDMSLGVGHSSDASALAGYHPILTVLGLPQDIDVCLAPI